VAAAATTPKAAPKTVSPLDYKNSTVEQVLNLFQKQLEKDVLAYGEESRRLSEYDAIVRDAQRDIATLTEQTHLGAHQQQEVEQTLSGIGDLEQELDRTLQLLEVQVDEIFEVAASLAPTDADRQREHAYATARALDTRLGELTDVLQQSLHQMDEDQERVFGMDPTIGPAVKVLYQHQTSILDLESAGQKLEHEVMQVSRLLSQK
jgi:nuclear pore complex protein Nup62